MNKKIGIATAFLVATSLLIDFLSPVGDSWLHVENGLIKDQSGNTVMLRGVHTFVCKENNQEKFNKIAEMGANVVRLGFWKNAVEGEFTEPCTEGLSGLDKAIGYARSAGLKVILDQHIWSYGVENAPLAFFTDPVLQQSWIDMWKMLIHRYKHNDTVIGIDLMNEPWAIIGRTIANKHQWEAIAKRAYTELHPLHPDLLIVINGWGIQTQPFWSDISFLQQPNIVLSDHIYNVGTARFLKTRYSAYLNADIPVFLGEIGFIQNEELIMLNRIKDFDTLGLHYTLYVFGSGDWNSPYDIAKSSPYPLSAIGGIYSNHIKSLQGRTN